MSYVFEKRFTWEREQRAYGKKHDLPLVALAVDGKKGYFDFFGPVDEDHAELISELIHRIMLERSERRRKKSKKKAKKASPAT